LKAPLIPACISRENRSSLKQEPGFAQRALEDFQASPGFKKKAGTLFPLTHSISEFR